jgi:hypothetical protein
MSCAANLTLRKWDVARKIARQGLALLAKANGGYAQYEITLFNDILAQCEQSEIAQREQQKPESAAA